MLPYQGWKERQRSVVPRKSTYNDCYPCCNNHRRNNMCSALRSSRSKGVAGPPSHRALGDLPSRVFHLASPKPKPGNPRPAHFSSVSVAQAKQATPKKFDCSGSPEDLGFWTGRRGRARTPNEICTFCLPMRGSGNLSHCFILDSGGGKLGASWFNVWRGVSLDLTRCGFG